MTSFENGRAICYSGYRKGQSPDAKIYPSYAQVKEDLLILQEDWKYLRLYDSGPHAEIVLDVVEKEELDFKIMLGAGINAEVSNPGCSWGAIYTQAVLEENRKSNLEEISKMAELANRYSKSVFSLSVGNETTAEWTDHKVPVERVVEYAKMVKENVTQPVTFCEGYVPWYDKLEALIDVVDFISLHSYPIWESKNIDVAFASTKNDYASIVKKHPNKPVVITEAGWTTMSNGVRIMSDNANEDLQKEYCQDLLRWSAKENVLTFLFEAFDEPWKGSSDLSEPEKHWGLYTVDRRPKKVVRALQSIRA
jgi:exo-beta-1,3-glucanase (GH17 family)